MRLVIAIFGLMGTLSAQVVYHPIDSNENIGFSRAIKPIPEAGHSSAAGPYLEKGDPLQSVRRFKCTYGTIALNNRKIVHHVCWEIPLPPDLGLPLLCGRSRNQERPPRYIVEHFPLPQGAEIQPRISLPDFCKITDVVP
jgi:hypothetical protein